MASVARWTRLRAVLAAALAMVGCGGDVVSPAVAEPTPALAPAPRRVEVEPVDAGVDAASVLDAATPPDAWRRPRPRSASEEVGSLFDPREDEAVLERLRTEDIVGVERGRGGRSVAFRVTLASGARAYFKPEQTFSGTHWYAEIAAFHLDRLLGLRRTAPSTGRCVAGEVLAPALEGDAHADEVVVGEDGMVRGALIAWMEERLVPLVPPVGWERALRAEPFEGIVPFVAPIELRRARARAIGDAGTDAAMTDDAPAGELLDAGGDHDGGTPWDEDARSAELSSLVVFDFLVHNGDRWGGGYTNVRTRGPGGPLVYLDNAAGFTAGRGRITLDSRLGFVQRFDRRLLRRVRRLEVGALEGSLASDPLAPILDEARLARFEERRAALLAHVDALVAELGEDRVMAW